MLGAVTLETPKPPQFQPELPKNSFCEKLDFPSFSQFAIRQRHTSNKYILLHPWCLELDALYLSSSRRLAHLLEGRRGP